MRVCFWNTARRADPDLVTTLCDDQDIDVLVLAECGVPVTTLLRRINTGRASLYYPDPSPGVTRKLTILTRFLPSQVTALRDTGDLAIRQLSPPLGGDFLLVALHLPSKMHYSDDDQMLLTPNLARAIRDAERQVGHERTVVIGDFNMNPFEPGMVGAFGFQAVMDRRVASRAVRTVRGDEAHYFYNPMWAKLGDFSSEPPGTYFYDAGKPITMYWHAFDQILLRPSLASFFQPTDLSIVTSIGSRELRSGTYLRPDRDISDHLPIVATLSALSGGT
jgi:hypothetical protein